MIELLTACTLLAAVGAEASSSRLAVIDRAPEFTLTTQSGEKLRLADLRGKVVLVGFIFTTCNGSCPATTHRMAQVQERLKSRGIDKDGRVRLLSITLDPARDTPEKLRDYMRLYDVDPGSWTFLTGPPETVGRTIAAWGMWARPAPNGQLDHPSRVFLVDAQGRIREIYNLAFLKPAWVVDDIALLLTEPYPAGKREPIRSEK
jgi:protein SCO1/2